MKIILEGMLASIVLLCSCGTQSSEKTKGPNKEVISENTTENSDVYSIVLNKIRELDAVSKDIPYSEPLPGLRISNRSTYNNNPPIDIVFYVSHEIDGVPRNVDCYITNLDNIGLTYFGSFEAIPFDEDKAISDIFSKRNTVHKYDLIIPDGWDFGFETYYVGRSSEIEITYNDRYLYLRNILQDEITPSQLTEEEEELEEDIGRIVNEIKRFAGSRRDPIRLRNIYYF
ncbi:MAG TPA: hypothetical protein PLW34_02580 [Termitinemataceae bacterium]|jgi:hypothetical protein|uniref:hypothetical protein n=1 Tax=Treponema sp. J25 TaxID=2094121 RepID=UPI001048F5AB|nr:hypothetical protein [Treponema sp. J25]TCW60439.1 hypothetical protein C5O22_11175 [Treponema sp. J25]HOJ98433.1 hypothetical protein [Termitinemataceae bacterium]HOM22799.1 hypothetical protein [Termitinemataceae bacterium]HPP99740.1 hypothetical protein [Termitinemataceae bacterium]